jgi:hypothetical protein
MRWSPSVYKCSAVSDLAAALKRIVDENVNLFGIEFMRESIDR